MTAPGRGVARLLRRKGEPVIMLGRRSPPFPGGSSRRMGWPLSR